MAHRLPGRPSDNCPRRIHTGTAGTSFIKDHRRQQLIAPLLVLCGRIEKISDNSLGGTEDVRKNRSRSPRMCSGFFIAENTTAILRSINPLKGCRMHLQRSLSRVIYALETSCARACGEGELTCDSGSDRIRLVKKAVAKGLSTGIMIVSSGTGMGLVQFADDHAT